MTQTPTPCIVCGVELPEVMPGITENQPAGGVTFTAPGNYGSTVFDPFDGSMIEVNVCDPCLVAAGEAGRVLLDRTARSVTFEGTVVGWEELESRLTVWTRHHPGFPDQRRLTPEEFSDPPLGVRIFPDSTPDPTPDPTPDSTLLNTQHSTPIDS
jgi:hypothetical protein